ncbi:hypothetical protein AVEN_84811-1 [Araneus ventricosus]|uniref:Uncharacterized protein n=1 Tax=Araneus ventricosus TaxID=182803 RepID=A0A4Y2IWU0_ARAVE|nr:hypothetical protein AVEN_84811-1 [Araneus ventricosus]
MKPETAPFLWTRRKRRAPGVYRKTDRALRQIRTPQRASPKALVQGLLRTVLARGPDSTLEDFSKGSTLTQPAVPDVAPSMSKGAKQVPVTPRHSERIHPVHQHLRSAEGPGSPRGVPNSGKRCVSLKAGTPDILFLGFDSAPATAPSQNATGRN